ncbi:MAG: hypothetical protein HY043_00130 [Verrucomicrobia bacterium]|nr:hypothetical protein [Verrucomicrobiota bacterium]
MKEWFRTYKWWMAVTVLVLSVLLHGLLWSLTLKQEREQARVMAAVQKYIERFQLQIAGDSRFQEVRLLGYDRNNPSEPCVAATGTVSSRQDWVALENFILNSNPPIPVSARSVLVRRPATNFTAFLHEFRGITPEGKVIFNGGPSRQPTVEMAYRHLLSTDLFAFGGVGFMGGRRGGELALRFVLTSTNAAEVLLAVASKGTPEAKIYALCGIQKLRLPEFDRLASELLTENPRVSSARGCVFSHEPASHLVSQIKAGRYDHSLRTEPGLETDQ